MKIETAHKILIGSGIAFFLVYAVFEVGRWWKGEPPLALVRAACGVIAAALFALYLRSFVKGLTRE